MKNKSNISEKRVIFIDEVRGLAIVLMVIYHFVYNLSNSMDISWFGSLPILILQYIFVGIFIFISGVSCTFSKNNLIRGIKCLMLGLLITVITYFFIPEQLIVFGILHMLGSCMIIYGALQKYIKYWNKKIILTTCIILFFISMNITNGYISIGNIILSLPAWLYQIKFLIPFGFINQNFYSADFFPLFPWLFLFIIGTIIGDLGNKLGFPNWMYVSHSKILSFSGRKSIYIYIFHQPALYFFTYLYNIIHMIFQNAYGG